MHYEFFTSRSSGSPLVPEHTVQSGGEVALTGWQTYKAMWGTTYGHYPVDPTQEMLFFIDGCELFFEEGDPARGLSVKRLRDN